MHIDVVCTVVQSLQPHEFIYIFLRISNIDTGRKYGKFACLYNGSCTLELHVSVLKRAHHMLLYGKLFKMIEIGRKLY